jgi:hypothetical protein
MLILGIAMAAGGTEYFKSAFTDVSSSHFTENKTSGLNISNNITVKTGYIVMIDGAASNSGLVPHSKLSSITNITGLKSVKQKISGSKSGIELFTALPSGTYNYVYFNSTPKAHLYGYITGTQFDTMAALIVVGGLISIIGFIVMIYGAIKKERPKNPYDPDDPYNIDNIKI